MEGGGAKRRGLVQVDSRVSGEGAVRELLLRHGFKYSKSKGQNFLIDKNIPEKIVRLSGVDKTCGVLEVGPGIGALTLDLSLAAGKVTAVELDARLLPILRDTLAERQNIEIIHGDILKTDIKKLVTEKMPGMQHHVCANLPYNITTPALTAFISAEIFKTITVMVQREVARRICAVPGSRDYGAFTVYVNYYCMPESLFDVPPECFMPRPAVWSTVIKMTGRTKRLLKPEDEPAFFRVVRAAFGQRRKTLVNALNAVFGNKMSKEEIAEAVSAYGLDVRTRGETLGLDQFIGLSKYFL